MCTSAHPLTCIQHSEGAGPQTPSPRRIFLHGSVSGSGTARVRQAERRGPNRLPCKSAAAPSDGATQVAVKSATQPNRWTARHPTLGQQPDGLPTRSRTCINSTSATSRYPTPTSGSSEAPRLPSGASSRPSCKPGGRAGESRWVQRYAQLDRHGCDARPRCAPCGTHPTPLFMQVHQLQPCLSCRSKPHFTGTHSHDPGLTLQQGFSIPQCTGRGQATRTTA